MQRGSIADTMLCLNEMRKLGEWPRSAISPARSGLRGRAEVDAA